MMPLSRLASVKLHSNMSTYHSNADPEKKITYSMSLQLDSITSRAVLYRHTQNLERFEIYIIVSQRAFKL